MMFILGVLFVITFMPILQTTTNLICAFIDMFNSKIQTKIAESNLMLTKTQVEIDAIQPTEEPTQAMRFRLDDCCDC